MNVQGSSPEKKYNAFIIFVSVLIPIAVAALFSVKLQDFGFNVTPLSFLPPIYAGVNGLTAVVLVCGVMCIRRGKIQLHKRLMTFAICLSICFLVMYVAYHMTSDSTSYGDSNRDGKLSDLEIIDAGGLRVVYLFILASHIILSVAVIPLVLISYVRALAQRFDRHRKIALITYPVWLYVAVTGVVVYFMISPFYAN